MSLLSICQGAIKEIGAFEVPASIIGNDNQTAVRLLNLCNRAGKLLSRRPERGWEVLSIEKSFTTTSGQAIQTSAIPADFRWFVNATWWDGANQWPLVGPVTPSKWEELNRGISSTTSSTHRYFRIRGGDFLLFPDPSNSTDTIYYEYQSSYWVDTDADGVGEATEWASDTDTALLDEDLLQMDLIWRFKQAEGLPYDEEFNAAEMEINRAIGHDGGKPVLSLTTRRGQRYLDYANIPDTGYGA